MGSKRVSAVKTPYILFAGIVGVIFLLLIGLEITPFFRDLYYQYLPHRFFSWQTLRHGQIPFWAPGIFGGSPFLANLQSCVFYPPQLLLTPLPFALGFKLFIALHFGIALGGTFHLARTVGTTPMGSTTAALAFSLGGALLTTLDTLTAFTSLAWLPWATWSLLYFFNAPGHFTTVLMAVIHALFFLAGEPQFFLFEILLAVPFIWGKKPSSKSFTWGMLGVLCFFCLTALQMIPFLEEITRSTRAEGMKINEKLLWSLHPVETFSLLVPTFTGTLTHKWFGQEWLRGLYIGVLPLTLITFAERKNSLARRLGFVAGIFFILACGSHIPIVRDLLAHLFPFSWVRYPVKFYLGTLFCLSLLAGLGWDGFTAAAHRKKIIFPITLALIALMTLAIHGVEKKLMLFLMKTFPNEGFPRVAKYVAEHLSQLGLHGVTLLGIAGLVFAIIKLKKPPVFLLSLIIFELVTYGPDFLQWAPDALIYQPGSFARDIKQTPQARVAFIKSRPEQMAHLFGERSFTEISPILITALGPSWGLMHGLGYATGYQGVTPQVTRQWLEAFHQLSDGNHFRTLLDEAGVTHIISFHEINKPHLTLLKDEEAHLYRFASALPPDTIHRMSPNHFTIDTPDLSQPTAYLIRERYHRHWQATAGKTSLTITPANPYESAMRVELPPHTSRLEFTYREIGWPYLGYLALVAWIGVSFILLKHRQSRKK